MVFNHLFFIDKMKQEKTQIASTEETGQSNRMPALQFVENGIQQHPDYLPLDNGQYPRIRFQRSLSEQYLSILEPVQSDRSYSLPNSSSFASAEPESQLPNPKKQTQNLTNKVNPSEIHQNHNQIQHNDEIKQEEKKDQINNHLKIQTQPKSNMRLINYNPLIFKKNVNMPKAVGRYLIKYYESFGKTIFLNHQQFYEFLHQQLQTLHVWTKKNKKNTFRLKHLAQFFNDSSKTNQQCRLNRLMMKEILIKYLRQETIPNNQAKDKREYLVGLKVYALRCANAKLATRMQMR